MSLFQNSVLKKYLAAEDQSLIKEAFSAYQKYFHHPQVGGNIPAAKEEQFQEGFLRELFVKIFGYTFQTEINRLDAEIDQMVYELYGLTEEEIRIVEGGELI